jgi:Right handed beta helix region
LNFDSGSQNIVVQGNSFADVSGGPIDFGDLSDGAQTNPALQNSGIIISNNYLTQTTLEYESSVGIFLGLTTNSNIIQNEIAGTNYTGISVGWDWTTAPTYASNNHITQNSVHDVMQTILDGGGVYTVGSQPNSDLTGNLIENIGPVATCNSSPSPNYLGYVGIYHDNGTQYYSNSKNVVRNSCGYWLLLEGGWPNPLNDTYDTTENNNYVDRDYTMCQLSPGSSAACNFDGNSVTNLTIFGASPTSDAQAVINAAGISAPYQYTKTIRAGPLY